MTLAFKQLLHNAIKYSFKPLPDLERNRYIRISGSVPSSDPGYYQISIQNYGVGITQDEIDTRLIFKPYYRGKLSTDRKRTGSGIGLAFVSQVIEEQHHGMIRVKSIRMRGEAYLTTFNVLLPLRQSNR